MVRYTLNNRWFIQMHILCVFKYYNIEQIPKEYIMRRRRRDVIPTKLLKRRFSNSLLYSNSDMTAIGIFSNVDRCVSFLSHDASKLKLYLEELNKLKKKFVDDCPASEMPSRESFYNQIIDIRNKGTGSRGKRLKSKKEMLEKVSSKPKRKCVYVNRWLTMINEIVLFKTCLSSILYM
uniref:Uncharacterized protein n=1 Tax=Lactuca sativa TaxID=4236 RepID=A0A9R1VGE0_LACSA|nr:hypothetical protein LSAT_V11C500292910 [Lactuca sativa]